MLSALHVNRHMANAARATALEGSFADIADVRHNKSIPRKLPMVHAMGLVLGRLAARRGERRSAELITLSFTHSFFFEESVKCFLSPQRFMGSAKVEISAFGQPKTNRSWFRRDPLGGLLAKAIVHLLEVYQRRSHGTLAS